MFLSLPTGELRTLQLGSDSQAQFLPSAGGPYTIQCGNETKTIPAELPLRADSGAYSSGENLFLVAGMAIIFLAALSLAAKFFLKPSTVFAKSESRGRVRICLCAGEDLREIRISDPQGGEDGKPLELFIPHLPAGASWSWEYDCDLGEPLLAARLSAKCANAGVTLLSGADGGGMQKQQADGGKKHEARKLARHSP